ncbi:patatin-like phospholipase family protein [Hymenobacter aquaticus]|nr:patatin-like phospholipase family protein [Hymenobacter aquaticus]
MLVENVTGQPTAALLETTVTPESVYARIALSLSGGGFRAAAYSLGTLKALHQLGLLENVHMLSTASGGTITGAYYAMRRKFGDAFEDIYQAFYALLEQDTILPNALTRWEERILREDTYKLIQAFADEYNQALYGEVRFGLFWQPDDSATAPFHLQSLIFGATEMYSGLTFRFQHSAFLPPPTGKQKECYVVGNGNVSLSWSSARQLRLADVVAASSCFPGGFEPLVMPNDFFSGNVESILRGRMGSVHMANHVALLDGGIYDNQGIESLLLANKRNREHQHMLHLSPQQAALLQPTTLFLVADVSSADTQIYSAPEPPQAARASPTLQQLFYGALLVVLLSGILAGWLTWTGWRFWGGLLAGLAALGSGILILVRWLWRKLGRTLSNVGPTLPKWVRPRLRRLSVRQLGYLLTLRAGSTAKLLTSVFMRRVRSLNYDQLYRRGGKEKASGEIMTSIIGGIVTDYERWLIKSPKQKSKSKSKKPMKVGEQLAAVYPTIDLAHQMPTTLWWQQDINRLPAIVASAEITLYYQILKRFEEKQPQAGTNEAEVQRRAQVLWDAYQQQGAGSLLPVEVTKLVQDSAYSVEQVLSSIHIEDRNQ